VLHLERFLKESQISDADILKVISGVLASFIEALVMPMQKPFFSTSLISDSNRVV
jgi:glycerol-3-phosphate responsive antiterminator